MGLPDFRSIITVLMSSMGIYGPPAILFFDRNGEEIRNRRVVGEMSGEELTAHINATLFASRKTCFLAGCQAFHICGVTENTLVSGRNTRNTVLFGRSETKIQVFK